MDNDKLNAQGDSTPAALAPPIAITPEQVTRHHRKAQGRDGGRGIVPSFIVPAFCFSYHSIRDSTEPKNLEECLIRQTAIS